MKATILQENFKKALSFVGKIVTTKTQLPVLSNVLLETENGRIKVSSTNLEASITFWVGATIETEGAITVPARLLSEIISSFSQEKVQIATNQSILQLTCGESEATLSGIDAKEFPPLPSASETKDACLKTDFLVKNLPLVVVSASSDEGRPLLTGVRFVVKNRELILAATDGYRLSVKKTLETAGFEEGFVVPAKALVEAARAAVDERAEEIELYFSKDRNQVLFLLPHLQISTRLIEGEYPAYEKIIPASFLTRVIFVKEELVRGVKLAAIYARESANIVRLMIAGGKAVVSANTPQIGENKTTIAVSKEGADGEIAFNVRFLLDFLQVFPEEQVVFEMNGALAPGVFKSSTDPSFLHIIMPVRVQS